MTIAGSDQINCRKLKTISPYLGMLASLLAVLFLVINAVWWLVPSLAEVPARGMSAVGAGPITLSLDVRLAGLALSTLHLSLLAIALVAVRQVLVSHSKGEMLQVTTGAGIRRCGLALLVFGVATPFVRTLMTLLVTIRNPAGEKALAIAFSANEFIISLVGFLLMIVGWAIAEAAQIADDNRQIV